MQPGARSEWVWITARTPELTESEVKEAMNALTDVFPGYDVALLAGVPRTDCKPLI